MADLEDALYSSTGRMDDSPADQDSRNVREGSRESDHDDRDRRRRGGEYERDLRRENRRFAPYPSRSDERSSSRRQSGSGGKECRVYVWNLSYAVKWQDLKDFMKKVGDVAFVDIMEDSHGKSKGCGIVEFRTSEDADKAIKELHGTEFRGRTIHIREDRIEDSDRRSRPPPRGSDLPSLTGGGMSLGNSLGSGLGGGNMGLGGSGGPLGNLLGMGNLNFAQGLNYRTDPLSCTVFVSNLDYKVTWQKIKDTFRGAGNVIRADINLDSDNKSKGFGTVQFETAAEAINAVSMFHGQILSDRAMSVRLDRNAPIMQQLSNLGVNNTNMGRAGGNMNPMAVLQLLQSLQGLSTLAQLTSNLGALGGSSGGLAPGGGFGQSGGGGGGGMGDSSGANPLAALGGLGMLSNTLGLGGGSGGGGGGGGMGGLGSSFPSDSGTSGRQVFVRNLPWRYTWQDLKDKFKGAGRVVRADIMTETSGRSKGCGTVLFDTPEDAAHAINMFNGALVDGREIDVRMDRLG